MCALLIGVLLEHDLDKGGDGLRVAAGNGSVGPVDNSVPEILEISSLKGWLQAGDFVHDAAEAPDVGLKVVPLELEHLWRDQVWGPDVGRRQLLVISVKQNQILEKNLLIHKLLSLLESLGNTKVAQL